MNFIRFPATFPTFPHPVRRLSCQPLAFVHNHRMTRPVNNSMCLAQPTRTAFVFHGTSRDTDDLRPGTSSANNFEVDSHPAPCYLCNPYVCSGLVSSLRFHPSSAASGKAFALTDEQLNAAVDFLDPNQDGNVSCGSSSVLVWHLPLTSKRPKKAVA